MVRVVYAWAKKKKKLRVFVIINITSSPARRSAMNAGSKRPIDLKTLSIRTWRGFIIQFLDLPLPKKELRLSPGNSIIGPCFRASSEDSIRHRRCLSRATKSLYVKKKSSRNESIERRKKKKRYLLLTVFILFLYCGYVVCNVHNVSHPGTVQILILQQKRKRKQSHTSV